MIEAEENDNPVTYVDTSREAAGDHQEHKHVTISDSAAATQQKCDDDDDDDDEEEKSTSLSSEEDLPQSMADVLAAAGVSLNLEELQMLQAEQAPLELVTEVRHTTKLISV